MVAKFGVGAKLRIAVTTERGWRPPNYKTGDEGEWFAQWNSGFAEELAAAITELRRSCVPMCLLAPGHRNACKTTLRGSR